MKVIQEPPKSLSRLGFKISMYFFVLVILMGILNAFKFWSIFGTAERGFLLAHVHMGTLGVLSMGILTFFLSEVGVEKHLLLTKIMGSALAVFIVAIVLKYLTGYAVILGIGAVIGYTAMAHVGVNILVYAYRNNSELRYVYTLNIGSLLLGILYGFIYSLRDIFSFSLTGDTLGAHATSIEGGFLIMASMIILDFVLGKEYSLWQASPFALYSVLLGLGLFFDSQLLLQPAIIFFILGALLAVARFVRSIDLGETVGIHAGFSVLGVISYAIFLIAITVNFLSQDKVVPGHLFVGSSHLVFLVIVSNALFGYMYSKLGEVEELFKNSYKIFVWGFNITALLFVLFLLLDMGGHMATIMGPLLLIGVFDFLKSLNK